MTNRFSPSNLLPERPILVYPSLASTIGLEEATLLSSLDELCLQLQPEERNGYTWYRATTQQLAAAMPFWDAHDIQRVSTNLREKGLIFIGSAAVTSSHELKFAFNERRQINRSRQTVSNTSPPAGLNTIAPNWRPDNETLERLAQHAIPSAFAHEQVPEFVNYWRERREAKRAWGSVFMKHVLHKWHEFKARANEKPEPKLMEKVWRPSEDALDVLTQHAGISAEFVEDAIPEFVLYWRERGVKSDNWNRKFRDHVHRQWIKYCSALEHDTTPRRIASNWAPSNEVYDVLRLANIDTDFAKQLIPEFVIYWRDTNQVHASWNTRFLQFVKRSWASQSTSSNSPNGQFNQVKPKSTRELSISDELNDRSWAI